MSDNVAWYNQKLVYSETSTHILDTFIQAWKLNTVDVFKQWR